METGRYAWHAASFYSAGKGSAKIRRRIAANTLVSDQFSIFFGRASRRHMFPKLWAIRLSHSRTSFNRNRGNLTVSSAPSACLL